MNKVKARNLGFASSCLAALFLCNLPVIRAASEADLTVESSIPEPKTYKSGLYESYILGPGDTIQVEVLDLPELSGVFSIGPDGLVYLPRLRSVFIEGQTIKSLNKLLTDRFREYVQEPELYIKVVGYRPIRIYVGGEVQRPGYYTLMGTRVIERDKRMGTKIQIPSTTRADFIPRGYGESSGSTDLPQDQGKTNVFPTLFDAIRASQGSTAYSNLSKVKITRKRSIYRGGGRIGTTVNFLSMITKGDDTQNLRLFDGDVVRVPKSSIPLREQLLEASQTNLSPQFFEVFVSGRVKYPGAVTLPQGSSLNKAILAGSPKVLRGKIEFVRFTKGGDVDRRVFSYQPNAPVSDYRNPILMSGDIVRVQDSLFTSTLEIVNEVSAPFVGVYSLYNLFGLGN